MLGLSVLIVSYTPQLKNMILRKINHNRIHPIDGITLGSIPTRGNTVNKEFHPDLMI